MKPFIRTGAPVLALTLLLAACGGGDGDKTATPTTQTTTTSAQQTQGGAVTDPLLGQRCVQYAQLIGAMALGVAAAMDPTKAKELEEVRAKADLGDVPEEIRDDYEVILTYAADLGEVLSKYDLKSGNPDPQAMAAIAEFSQQADSKRIQTASENVSTWLGANCPG